ncbi:MAG: ATP-binding protein [Acidimicrobiia bacterium]
MQTRTGLSMAAVLFTDIEGSSRLWETARAEMDRVLAEHDRRLRAVVECHGGVIFATVGDGFGVAFETVSAAVAAARAARDGIADLLVAGEQLRVRMGIHVGEVSNREGDVFGPTVNRCARLMDLAWGGQIVVSDAAARLCVDDPELVDLGVYVLRGLSEPERVHQLGNGSFPPLRARPWSPLEAPRLVGRDLLIDQVVEELERHRLVTLVGPVGVGKSALVHATAAEIHRRGGVCVVADVNHDDDPDGIVWGIASQAAGGRRLAGDPLAAIGAALSPSAGVVILDGCQERCPSVVDAVRRLLDGTTVRVLAASRRGFGLPRERCVRVDPLAVPDSAAPGEATSVEFLVQEAARHGIEVTDSELPDLGRIASALGGLPLALELAAGKLAVLSARELADRLDAEGGTALLGGTLTRIVDDAVDALTADTRGLLACLSVCRGSFSLDTALAVSGCPEEAVVDGLEELADHAIVTVDSSGGTRRYRIHEPVRRRVLASQDSYEVRRRHAVHQLEIARQAKDLTNTDEAAGLALLDVEYRQCGDALEWAVEAEEVGIGLELASALRWYWWARGCPTAVPGWLDGLLAADRTGVAPEIVAEGLQTAGTLAYRHQVSTARRLLDEAVRVFASVVDGGDAGPGLVFAY